MPLNRRELLQATGSAVIGAASTADRLRGLAQAATGDEFSIENVFADFMRDIGGSAEDPGGRVLFTGRDPILQSHFRLGACMAISRHGGRRGGRGRLARAHRLAQELSIDLRQAVYGIAPWARFLADYNVPAGTLPPGWLPPEWNWDPTLNGRNIQVPFILGDGTRPEGSIMDQKDRIFFRRPLHFLLIAVCTSLTAVSTVELVAAVLVSTTTRSSANDDSPALLARGGRISTAELPSHTEADKE